MTRDHRITAHSADRALTTSASLVAVLATADPAAAQRGEEATACAACGALGGALLVVPVLILALNLALLVWVARDARARGMDSAVLWMLLVMFTSVIGLAIYVMSRPQGAMSQCPHCKNRRLAASARCPHCANA